MHFHSIRDPPRATSRDLGGVRRRGAGTWVGTSPRAERGGAERGASAVRREGCATLCVGFASSGAVGCDRSVAMAGGMDVHKNVHVENWGTARENLEKTFRFSRRNITLAVVFGIAVPLLTYQGVTSEFHKQDAAAGQPPRKFLGTE